MPLKSSYISIWEHIFLPCQALVPASLTDAHLVVVLLLLVFVLVLHSFVRLFQS